MSAALELDHVTVDLSNQRILESINLTIAPGTLTALVGPNGSGKSTLLATIAGLIETTGGQVKIQQHCVRQETVAARRQLGFMIAQEKLPALLTPRQCLVLFAESRGLDDIPELTKEQSDDFGLAPWMDTPLDECSLGTRQKLAVLLSLIDNPALILLDEPMNGLDPVSAAALKSRLVDLRDCHGCAVIMATHDLSIITSLADHVLVLLDGRLEIDWGPAELARVHAENKFELEDRIVQVLKYRQRHPIQESR